MTKNASPRIQRHRRHLFIAGPLLLLSAIFLFYYFTKNFVSSDDAYVKAARTSINANVSGQVLHLDVRDNQKVKEGDVLFQLDQRPYQLAVEKQKAELANAYLKVQALKTMYLKKIAEMRAAKDTLIYAHEEWLRQKKMNSSGLSSKMALNKAKNTFERAQQSFVAAKQQQKNSLAQLNDNPDVSPEQLPIIQIALANLHQALLNLSYTTVKAPANGVVTKVDDLQQGDYVQTGAPVFALISTENVWVEANFKETQMMHLHPGQKARIEIDAYPNKKWSGHVISQSPGTGSAFALLPPENATGNWVKVSQRIPVQISIDQANKDQLATGLSATVTVDTHS